MRGGRSAALLLVTVLSLSRIPIAAVFLFLYTDPSPRLRMLGFAFVFLAVITDFADGALARRFQVTTKAGYLIDGVGDRAAYIAVIMAVCARDDFPSLLGFALIFRDIGLYATRSYFPNWDESLPIQRTVAHLHAGVVRTVLACYLIVDAITLFAARPFAAQHPKFMMALTALGGVFTAISYVSLYRVIVNLKTAHPEVADDDFRLED